MEIKTSIYTQKYTRAKKRIEVLKLFYTHLVIFIVANPIIIFIRFKIYTTFPKEQLTNGFIDWVDYNVFGTLIVWSIILFLHWLYIKNAASFIKNWEEKQISKFLDKLDKEKQ